MLNLGVDPTQSGQLAAVFDFHYNMLHMDYMLHGGTALSS